MPKISVVVPVYKAERYIKRCCRSLFAQTLDDIEYVFVDDCSPDRSIGILKSVLEKFPQRRGQVRFLRNPKNLGTSLTRQKGIKATKGDYVILATDDDVYESNFLSEFLPLIEKYPKADLFRARILQVDSNNTILQIDRTYKEYLSEIEFRYHMMHGIRGGIPQYIFKRRVLIRKGGFVNFPLAWGADDATAMMMSTNGVVTSQEHLVRFRWSDINISSERKHTGLEKLNARLMQIKWMKDHPVAIGNLSIEWADFYQREVIDFLSIFSKQLLIQKLKEMPLTQWLLAYRMIRNSHLFSGKEICSVFYHVIRRCN